MSVSVVMPVYDGAATLDAAIASIAGQTHADWELVVVDDGSRDGSAEVVRNWMRRDRRVRLVERPHEGIVSALIAGCAAAEGPILARMDADDVAHPERLAKQVRLLASDSRIGLCGTRVRMTGPSVGDGRRRYEQWINGLLTHEDMVRELFVECPIPHPTFMMRKEAYASVGGYEDHGWAEDYDLVFRLFTKGYRFAKTVESLLDWAESPGRLSMQSSRYSPAQFRAAKRWYLSRTWLRGRTHFHQWGAGEVGKQWLRAASTPPDSAECLKPVAVVDINPRKVGRSIHGVPVIPPEALPRPGDGFTVVAVGAPGAREEIRQWMQMHGYVELEHYIFLA